MEITFTKDKKCRFRHHNKLYTIPSVTYPLVPREEPKLFYEANTAPIRDVDIIHIINTQMFELGKCYINTQSLYLALIESGYEAEYYSGWLFLVNGLPVHHAWVILKISENLHLIDSSYHKSSHRALKLIKEKHHANFNDRKSEFTRFLLTDMMKRKNNTDKMIDGQVHSGHLYIGCPSSYEEAVTVFEMLKKKKAHPSYHEDEWESENYLLKLMK